MKLFHNPASPFVRKVMMVLHETGQLGDVELVAAAGHVLDVSNMPVADNPLGKIPTLVRPDAPTLYDSRVICRYLDVRAGGDLCGRGEMLWDYATIEATADGIMDACVLMVYERRVRPADKRFPDWVEGQWAKAERATQALNDRWLSHLQGPVSIASISAACALGYMDFRHGDRDWRATVSDLAKWFADFGERASFKATMPSG